jgi:hypothetical protein
MLSRGGYAHWRIASSYILTPCNCFVSRFSQAPRVMARLKDSEEYAWGKCTSCLTRNHRFHFIRVKPLTLSFFILPAAFDLWHRRLLSSNADAAGADHDGEVSRHTHFPSI